MRILEEQERIRDEGCDRRPFRFGSKAGNSFTEGVEGAAESFSRLYVNMVRGEKSAGRWMETLNRLAAWKKGCGDQRKD